MSDWKAVEPDLKTALEKFPNPIKALAHAQVPAVVIRQAYDPAQGLGLIRRFTNMGLMRDGTDHKGQADQRVRIDIGTSLGLRGHEKDKFLDHAETSHFMFKFLFEGFDNPVNVMYDALRALCPGKDVKVAREKDGRLYGPAIFRVHYDGHRYKPHIDHVVLRENRTAYEVYRFKHQFAGVLCLQNADASGPGVQSLLHRCVWTPEVQPHITNDTFYDYAKEKNIEHSRVVLQPGDLYNGPKKQDH